MPIHLELQAAASRFLATHILWRPHRTAVLPEERGTFVFEQGRKRWLTSFRSREQSQSSMAYSHDNPVDATVTANASPLSLEAAANALNKFGFDCAFYRRTKRDLLANGWSEAEIFGRSEIDVDTLLLGFMDPQDAQPVSTWCSRTVNKLLPATPLPVRLASTWLLTKLMRVSLAFRMALSRC